MSEWITTPETTTPLSDSSDASILPTAIGLTIIACVFIVAVVWFRYKQQQIYRQHQCV
jgi:hypothetical protein